MYVMKQIHGDSITPSINYDEDAIGGDYEVESKYKLLGVSGVEDLLQDNVQTCIQDLICANIKVWMLTGDKGETAENIGKSCGII